MNQEEDIGISLSETHTKLVFEKPSFIGCFDDEELKKKGIGFPTFSY